MPDQPQTPNFLAEAAAAPRTPDGLEAALASLEPDARLEAEAESGDLFAGSPLHGRADLRPVRGRGRPPGSLNKTTDEWRAYFLRHYRSPLLTLGDLIAADPLALHGAIVAADQAVGGKGEVSLLAVLQLQLGAATALAPYVHRKQPIAIDAGEDKDVPLIAQFILDAASLARAQRPAAGAPVVDVEPVAETAEVAGQKSQNPGGDGLSG